MSLAKFSGRGASSANPVVARQAARPTAVQMLEKGNFHTI
jgi:hypothetical protein